MLPVTAASAGSNKMLHETVDSPNQAHWPWSSGYQAQTAAKSDITELINDSVNTKATQNF
jgi:hypothetical protein